MKDLKRILRRSVAVTLILAFMLTDVRAYAQGVIQLPPPGTRLALGPVFAPPLLKGIKVFRNDPFRFDFILDKGDTPSSEEQDKTDSTRLIKYFLASLTVPEKDLWVNLSPYEKDRIVPEAFGQTEMGRDLLAQDYILKQITASVIYPDEKTGKEFWARVYAEARKRYGTTDIPVDTFNKVWIVPEKATVYEHQDAAFVVESRLKVMLESDYVAANNNLVRRGGSKTRPDEELAKQILRDLIIPILEKEVNEGRNFATLRQIYNSHILATWYKRKIKAGIMGRAYVDQKKTSGVDIADKNEKEKIWAKYVEAFKKGVYNFIKEEYDPVSREMIPRKYFSGGMSLDGTTIEQAPAAALTFKASLISMRVSPISAEGQGDRAQTPPAPASPSLDPSSDPRAALTQAFNAAFKMIHYIRESKTDVVLISGVEAPLITAILQAAHVRLLGDARFPVIYWIPPDKERELLGHPLPLPGEHAAPAPGDMPDGGVLGTLMRSRTLYLSLTDNGVEGAARLKKAFDRLAGKPVDVGFLLASDDLQRTPGPAYLVGSYDGNAARELAIITGMLQFIDFDDPDEVAEHFRLFDGLISRYFETAAIPQQLVPESILRQNEGIPELAIAPVPENKEPLPDVLLRRGYRLIRNYGRGGSSSSTYLVEDQEGRRLVLKYADWEGISGNGTPWLVKQVEKLRHIQADYPASARLLYPKVVDFYHQGNVAYYTMEYFAGAVDSTKYYFFDPFVTMEEFDHEVRSFVGLMTETHYQHQLEPYADELGKNVLVRMRYRLGLLPRHDGDIYDRLIKGFPFHVGALSYPDASYFFEALMKPMHIVINGKVYPNLPVLLKILEKQQKKLEKKLGPTHFGPYSHGDIPLRNVLRLPDGQKKIIDVRGLDIHPTSPSKTSVEYDLAKIAHGFLLEMVRNGYYQLNAGYHGGSLAFEYHFFKYPGNSRYQTMRDNFYALLADNSWLARLLGTDGSDWLAHVKLGEYVNYASDAIHRFSQDPTGEHPLLYYLNAIEGLYAFLKAQGLLPDNIMEALEPEQKKSMRVLASGKEDIVEEMASLALRRPGFVRVAYNGASSTGKTFFADQVARKIAISGRPVAKVSVKQHGSSGTYKLLDQEFLSLDWFLRARAERQPVIEKVINGEIPFSKYQSLAWDMQRYEDLLRAMDAYARREDGTPFRYEITSAYDRVTGLNDLDIQIELESQSVVIVEGVGCVDEISRRYFDTAVLVDVSSEERVIQAAIAREARKPLQKQLSPEFIRRRLQAVDTPRMPYFRYVAGSLHDYRIENSDHKHPVLSVFSAVHPDGEDLSYAGTKDMDRAMNAGAAFTAKFGDASPDVLRFIAGVGDVSRIKKYEPTFVQADPMGQEVYRHDIQLDDSPGITFFSKTIPNVYQHRFVDENELTNEAAEFGLAEKMKMFALKDSVLLVQQAQPGQALGDLNMQSPIVVNAVGYALGRLHGLGIIHRDVYFNINRHIFLKRNLQGALTAFFIDFGIAQYASEEEINEEYEGVKASLAHQEIFQRAYARGRKSIHQVRPQVIREEYKKYMKMPRDPARQPLLTVGGQELVPPAALARGSAAVYPGYFDKFDALGLDVIKGSLGIYNKLVLLVLSPPGSASRGPLQTRINEVYALAVKALTPEEMQRIVVVGASDPKDVFSYLKDAGIRGVVRKFFRVDTEEKLDAETLTARTNFDVYDLQTIFMIPGHQYLQLPRDPEAQQKVNGYCAAITSMLQKKFPDIEGYRTPLTREALEGVVRDKGPVLELMGTPLPELDPHTAFYAGSFDPVTNGHLEVIRQAANVYRKVIVGIGVNPDKTPLFGADTRKELIEESLRSMGISNVEVVAYDAKMLTVQVAARYHAGTLMRGARSVKDIKDELSLAWVNSILAPSMRTVLVTPQKFEAVSSSFLKAAYAADDDIAWMAPGPVFAEMMKVKLKDIRKDTQLIGLVGGIGAGKTTVTEAIEKDPLARVISMDKIGHEVLAVPEVVEELVGVFGADILTDGKVDRLKLRGKTLGDPRGRGKRVLDGIVRSRIMKALYERIGEVKRTAPDVRLIVVEGAVMMEMGAHRFMDAIWYLDTPEDIRVQRALMDPQRKGLSEEQVRSTIYLQRSTLEYSLQKADRVLRNAGQRGDLEGQVRQLNGMSALRLKWKKALGIMGLEDTENLFARIEQKYSEEHRYYHNWEHILTMFDKLEVLVRAGELDGIVRKGTPDHVALLLAILLHDVVYNAVSGVDEDDSIEFTIDQLRLAGFSKDIIDRVTYLIGLTKTHDVPGNDQVAQLFMDLDIMVLGAPRREFDAYDRNIRREYQRFTFSVYRERRMLYLEQWANAQHLFYLPVMQRAYDAQARENALSRLDHYRRLDMGLLAELGQHAVDQVAQVRGLRVRSGADVKNSLAGDGLAYLGGEDVVLIEDIRDRLLEPGTRVYVLDNGWDILITADAAATHRLTIAEARERLFDSLKAIKSLYPAFQKACSDGLEVFKKEGAEAFESRSYPVIKAEAEALRVHVDAVRGVPALLGFSEPEMKAKLDPFLRQIAEEAKVDKVLISFENGFYYNFSYARGFTDEEIVNYRLQKDEISNVISDPGIQMNQEMKARGMNALRSAGMASGLKVSTDEKWLVKVDDAYISIVIGRSAQGVSMKGELTENDRNALAAKLNAFVINGPAPWSGIRKFLDNNEYKAFDDFMYFLRHNSGIDTLWGRIFPVIYKNIPELLNRTRDRFEGNLPWHDEFLQNLERLSEGQRVPDTVATFLELLEVGTELKSRDITPYIHQRVASFKGMAEARKLVFISELSNEGAVVPACDLNLLGGVVDNLIQNAINFTLAGTVTVRFGKKMMKPEDPKNEQGSAVLEVEDTGIGVPADERQKIFVRGYRAKNTAGIFGTGIGLDAVSTIVRSMGGDIRVEPGESGKGSKFIVRLPLVQDPSQARAAGTDRAPDALLELKKSEKVLNKLNSSIMIAIGGVSGAGKTTLIKYILEKYPDYFTGLVMTTTRPPKNEDDASGMLELISESEFASREQAGDMYFVTTHYGYRYGYYRRNLERALKTGKMLVCIMDEEVKLVRSLFPHAHVKRISIVPMMDIFQGDKLKKVEAVMRERLQQRDPDMAKKDVERRSRITQEMVNILRAADIIFVNDLSVDSHRMFEEMDLFFTSSLSRNHVPENSGGIDLNPAKFDLEARNSDSGIAFNLDPTMLARLQNASGVSPVIISVRPLESLSGFFGVQKPVK